MLHVFLVVAVAVMIVGIGPTRVTATLLLFFVYETLAGCVETVEDVYWWIAAEVGMFSGGLVVRQADEGRSDETEIRFAVS
jgi:hypothetical protein